MRGLTRIINGDAWKRRSTSGKQFGVPDVSVDVSLGIRTLELKDEILDKGVGLASEINIEYGDRFDAEDTKTLRLFLHPGESELAERSTGSGGGQLHSRGRWVWLRPPTSGFHDPGCWVASPAV